MKMRHTIRSLRLCDTYFFAGKESKLFIRASMHIGCKHFFKTVVVYYVMFISDKGRT